MALGLIDAGFDIKIAFDNDEDAVATYKRNLHKNCEQLDALKVSGKRLLREAGLSVGELDLFSGGPPCQGFSKQKRGAHLLDDQRNRLIVEYVRLVKEMDPKTFVFENVAIFGQKRGKAYLDELAVALRHYHLWPHFYNSADYGLAQTRQRFVLVGVRRDLEVGFEIPKPTVSRWKTVGESLKGLPEPPSDYSDHPKFPNHARARVTQANIERFSFVPQGGGWQDIPWKYRLECHKVADVKSGGWPDVYGRLEMNGQAPTITGGFDSFTRGRYGHPKYDRPLTPREAARLQGLSAIPPVEPLNALSRVTAQSCNKLYRACCEFSASVAVVVSQELHLLDSLLKASCAAFLAT